MKKILPILFILITAIIVNSCRRDKYIPNVCFKENILPIFITKCSTPGCHNSSNSSTGRRKSDFTTYEGIMQRVTANHSGRSDVYTKIKGNNSEMPPKGSPQLTAKEIEYIKFWIDFGAQNSSCGTSNCDTTSYINYNGVVKDLITTNCVGCHFTGNSQSIALDNYANVSGNGQKIISRITLPTTNALHMPQGYPLSTCDLTKIQKWVNNGMPE